MSERFYRVLLRLYPSRFRQSYGKEALQLFRDRMGDERGWLRRSRLWLDLLVDLGAIRIRGYHEAATVRAAAEAGAGRIPSFASLEERPVEARFLVWGGFLSVIFCGVVLLALQHERGRLPFGSAGKAESGFVASARLRPRIEFTYKPVGGHGGSVVRLHAVVRGEVGSPVPTGQVTFLEGWNTFVIGKLVDGAVTVEATVPKGKRQPLSALYTGDVRYGSVNSLEKAQ